MRRAVSWGAARSAGREPAGPAAYDDPVRMTVKSVMLMTTASSAVRRRPCMLTVTGNGGVVVAGEAFQAEVGAGYRIPVPGECAERPGLGLRAVPDRAGHHGLAPGSLFQVAVDH